jgi:hypothetical protein
MLMEFKINSEGNRKVIPGTRQRCPVFGPKDSFGITVRLWFHDVRLNPVS